MKKNIDMELQDTHIGHQFKGIYYDLKYLQSLLLSLRKSLIHNNESTFIYNVFETESMI